MTVTGTPYTPTRELKPSEWLWSALLHWWVQGQR